MSKILSIILLFVLLAALVYGVIRCIRAVKVFVKSRKHKQSSEAPKESEEINEKEVNVEHE